jgi:hypothetical protein
LPGQASTRSLIPSSRRPRQMWLLRWEVRWGCRCRVWRRPSAHRHPTHGMLRIVSLHERFLHRCGPQQLAKRRPARAPRRRGSSSEIRRGNAAKSSAQFGQYEAPFPSLLKPRSDSNTKRPSLRYQGRNLAVTALFVPNSATCLRLTTCPRIQWFQRRKILKRRGRGVLSSILLSLPRSLSNLLPTRPCPACSQRAG